MILEIYLLASLVDKKCIRTRGFSSYLVVVEFDEIMVVYTSFFSLSAKARTGKLDLNIWVV